MLFAERAIGITIFEGNFFQNNYCKTAGTFMLISMTNGTFHDNIYKNETALQKGKFLFIIIF